MSVVARRPETGRGSLVSGDRSGPCRPRGAVASRATWRPGAGPGGL